MDAQSQPYLTGLFKQLQEWMSIAQARFKRVSMDGHGPMDTMDDAFLEVTLGGGGPGSSGGGGGFFLFDTSIFTPRRARLRICSRLDLGAGFNEVNA